MSYIKPQITPPSPLIFAILNGGSFWHLNSAGLGSLCGKPEENTRNLTWRVGGDAWMRFGLAHFFNGYSFLMVSPNLLDFWAIFFLILSRFGMLHLLIVFRT